MGFGVYVNSERVKPLNHRLPVLNLVIEFVAHAEPAQPAYRAIQKNLRFHRVVVAPVHDVFRHAAPHLAELHVVGCASEKIYVVSIETLVAAQNIDKWENSINCNGGASVLLELFYFLVSPLLARREFKILLGFFAPLFAAVDRRLKPPAAFAKSIRRLR